MILHLVNKYYRVLNFHKKMSRLSSPTYATVHFFNASHLQKSNLSYLLRIIYINKCDPNKQESKEHFPAAKLWVQLQPLETRDSNDKSFRPDHFSIWCLPRISGHSLSAGRSAHINLEEKNNWPKRISTIEDDLPTEQPHGEEHTLSPQDHDHTAQACCSAANKMSLTDALGIQWSFLQTQGAVRPEEKAPVFRK